MSTITLEINNAEIENLICQLANKLNIKYTKKEVLKENDTTLLDKMNELAGKIDEESSFGDASEYQREVRKDRKLPYRD